MAKYIPKVIVGEVDDEMVNVIDVELIHKFEGITKALEHRNLEWRPEVYV